MHLSVENVQSIGEQPSSTLHFSLSHRAVINSDTHCRMCVTPERRGTITCGYRHHGMLFMGMAQKLCTTS